ncbi:MAG: U32 family peptidase [Verrucomicrobiota bacterium]
MNRKPELLAPSGNWDCAKAAVANGADAIFFGLSQFNARMRADNFTLDDLPELMDYLHERGVRGYVTFNTLVFTQELPEAERFLKTIEAAGVDAIIVQDLGIVRLAQAVAPHVRIHASTQMTLTSPEGVQFAKKWGVKRAVLARELSIRELEKFKGTEILPLEVFVHGALCVAYSGQCLTSEALGQRSANRGECAQACRLPYEMVVDGVIKDLGDKRYLLSPQDLAAIEEIPRLIDLGIESFKIEGRLKTPEYVAAITQVYRKAIDACFEGKEISPEEKHEDRYQMEMAFSRGLYSGWMHGVNHQELVHARFGKKRGAFVGFIKRVGSDEVEVDLEVPVQAGDGVVFDTGGDTDREQGGRVWAVKGSRLQFEPRKLNLNRIKVGDRLWKTDDPHLQKKLRQSFSKEVPPRKKGVTLVVTGRVGEPLKVEAALGEVRVSASSSMSLFEAKNQPLTLQRIEEQMGRLGETPYELEKVSLQLEGSVMLPVKELNQLRRDWVEKLQIVLGEVIASTPSEIQEPRGSLESILKSIPSPSLERSESYDLRALCRTTDQIDAALEAGISTIYVDFEDIRRGKEAVAQVRAHGGSKIYLATPRIQKSGEVGFFKVIEQAEPDGVLIRNLGGIDYFRDKKLPLVGDFSLNVANPITAALLKQEPLDHLTISYDLNSGQVLDLLRAAPPEWFELTMHQHLPMFHMEHCVFAAFLSKGKDYTDCGRPCETHQVALKDRVGMLHPLKADVGCRNTVYHGKAQSGVDFFWDFVEAGVRRFRVELLTESKSDSLQVFKAYQDLMSKKIEAEELARRLKVVNQLGVTSGTLTVLG